MALHNLNSLETTSIPFCLRIKITRLREDMQLIIDKPKGDPENSLTIYEVALIAL
jgi:hypothetical protein